MKQLLFVLAQNARFERGLAIFKWGITGVGIAVILLGLALYFSKSKDSTKQTSATVRMITLGVCGLIGIGLIAYAWLGF